MEHYVEGKCKVLVTCATNRTTRQRIRRRPSFFPHNWIALCLGEDGQTSVEEVCVRLAEHRIFFPLVRRVAFPLLQLLLPASWGRLSYRYARASLVASYGVARADSNLASSRNFNIDDTTERIVHDNIIIHIQRQRRLRVESSRKSLATGCQVEEVSEQLRCCGN